MKATEVTAGLSESNGSLLPGLWRDSFHVTCGLTACTPGSAPGPMLGNEYGKTLPFTFNKRHTAVSSVDGCSNAVDIENKFAVNFQEACLPNNPDCSDQLRAKFEANIYMLKGHNLPDQIS